MSYSFSCIKPKTYASNEALNAAITSFFGHAYITVGTGDAFHTIYSLDLIKSENELGKIHMLVVRDTDNAPNTSWSSLKFFAADGTTAASIYAVPNTTASNTASDLIGVMRFCHFRFGFMEGLCIAGIDVNSSETYTINGDTHRCYNDILYKVS